MLDKILFQYLIININIKKMKTNCKRVFTMLLFACGLIFCNHDNQINFASNQLY